MQLQSAAVPGSAFMIGCQHSSTILVASVQITCCDASGNHVQCITLWLYCMPCCYVQVQQCPPGAAAVGAAACQLTIDLLGPSRPPHTHPAAVAALCLPSMSLLQTLQAAVPNQTLVQRQQQQSHPPATGRATSHRHYNSSITQGVHWCTAHAWCMSFMCRVHSDCLLPI